MILWSRVFDQVLPKFTVVRNLSSALTVRAYAHFLAFVMTIRWIHQPCVLEDRSGLVSTNFRRWRYDNACDVSRELSKTLSSMRQKSLHQITQVIERGMLPAKAHDMQRCTKSTQIHQSVQYGASKMLLRCVKHSRLRRCLHLLCKGSHHCVQNVRQ
jgi:hypothetical protein